MQMSKGTRLSAIALTVGMLAAGVATAGTAVATPAQSGCDDRTNNTYEKMLECVRVEGVREHQAALQAIADANGGNRAAGTEGYTDSADYVVDTLRPPAGRSPRRVPVHVLPATDAGAVDSGEGDVRDRGVHRFGHGDITGNVIPVDINLVPPRASTSGCEAADFAGSTSAARPTSP